MPLRGRLHVPLPLQLGAAISVDGIGRLVLPVGLPLRAVEHLVGTDVDYGRASPGAGLGHVAAPLAVDQQGPLGIRLTAGGVGPGSGVDDQLRP